MLVSAQPNGLLADAIPALVQMLSAMLQCSSQREKQPANNCSGTAYVATTKRNLATLHKFLHAISESQLHVQEITPLACPSLVQFQHHITLQKQRANIVLHEIRCNPDFV